MVLWMILIIVPSTSAHPMIAITKKSETPIIVIVTSVEIPNVKTRTMAVEITVRSIPAPKEVAIEKEAMIQNIAHRMIN